MTWTLPAPLAAGYAIEPVDPVIRTDMEVGSPRTRLRSQAELDHVTVSWIFSDADMTAFRAWFRDTAARGSAWFSLDLKLGNGGIETAECKFLGIWKSTYIGGGFFNVTGQVEVR